MVISTVGGAAQEDLASAIFDEFGEDFQRRGPLGDDGGELEMRLADYTFAELAGEYDRLLPNLLAHPDVRITDVNERENRIVIHTAPGRSAGVLDMVGQLSSNSDMVLVRALEREISSLNDHLREQFDTLLAGVQIQADGVYCSLGANMSRISGSDTIPGILIASHCTGDGSDMFDMDAVWVGQETDAVSDRIAQESIDPSEFACAVDPDGCRYSDAAIADLSSGVDASLGFIARTVDRNADTLEVDQGNPIPVGLEHTVGPSSGTIAEKIGATTGWTWDEIGDTCATVSPNGHSFSILCSYEVLAWAAGGDSGAPVFTGGTYYSPPTEARFAGILFAGDRDGADYFWYSPIMGIKDDLGSFSVLQGPS